MPLIESDNNTPRLKDQHASIAVGSPLAVLGLFVEVIRARFRPPNDDTEYVWRDDPTPVSNEDGTIDAPRFLYIEAGDGTDPEGRDVRPAIFVDKEETVLTQVVIGNRSNFDRQTRTERFYMQASIPITVRCVSDNRGESSILADYVWFHIASASNYIRSEFGINHIAAPVLSPTKIFRRSEGGVDVWNTSVAFAATIEFHWITKPIAPLLKEVRSVLTLNGNGDPTTGAIETVLRTRRTR